MKFIKCTILEYYHSFRPPIEVTATINVSDLAIIRETRIDGEGMRTMVITNTGEKFYVKETKSYFDTVLFSEDD